MNSTMKIIRPKITEHYAEMLEFLYLPEAKKVTNFRNVEAILTLIK